MKKSTAPRSGAQNSATRKLKRTAACNSAVERKLSLDADFFWKCVKLRNRGKDIRGASGRPYDPPSATSLFGAQYNAASPAATAIQGAEVIRSGGGESVPPVEKFSALRSLLPGFAYDNLVGEDRMRYSTPSPIQRHCVPLGLSGADCLACAQTGSGKTVAFLLPLIASIAARRDAEEVRSTGKTVGTARPDGKLRPAVPVALILAPTRELALQIEVEIEKLTFEAPVHGSGSRWCVAVYGGTKPRPQLEALASGVEIVVATPGRLVDFMSRGLVSLAHCDFLVVDEADRMLDMGFGPQLRKIVEESDMPKKEDRQTLLFSATFPKNLQEIARRSYLREGHAKITIGRIGASNAAVTQRLVRCAGSGTKRDKLETLLPLLEIGQSERTIVFVNKKHHATWLARELDKRKMRCVQIHGDRTQPQREKALNDFRDGVADILVATDAVSRGIDINDVSHVVQFDLPVSTNEFESYTHRIGRTGRAGKTGVATAIYVSGNEPKLGNGGLWWHLKKTFEEVDTSLPGWFGNERPGSTRRLPQTRTALPDTKTRRSVQRSEDGGRGPMRKHLQNRSTGPRSVGQSRPLRTKRS